MSALRRLLGRALLAGFGMLLGLVFLEALLQLAAPLLRPSARQLDAAAARAGGTLRILCVGDSHTYGIWVDPQDTYPARLRRHLARWPEPVVVLNAGVPGMNSSQVAQVLPEMLERFAPDVLLVMVGVADFWNLDSLEVGEYSGWRWVLAGGGLWDRSRVVKLARLLRFNLKYGRNPLPAEAPVVTQTPYNWKIYGTGDAAIDVGIDMHFSDGVQDIVVFRRILRRDLSLIAAQAEARGVMLVLMTYPTNAGLYGAVNEVYRQFAPANGLPLIDLGNGMSRWASPRLSEKAYFPDFHPRRAGYEAASRLIADQLYPLVHGTTRPAS